MEHHRTRPLRRLTAALVAITATAGLGTVVPDAKAAAGFQLTRVAGADRFATAATLATNAFANPTTNAILATGLNFADALAGSYLAGQLGAGAPILLTNKDDVPATTVKAMDDLGVTKVYILGGTGAISDAVKEDLGEREIVRIAGNNRYETAAEVATESLEGAPGVGTLNGKKTVIVASGEGFADALASGPVAFAGRFPILLTPAGQLSTAASGAMDTLDVEHAVIVGGTAAVSQAVATSLQGKGMTVQRVAGNNRYETAVAIAKLAIGSLGFSQSAIDLASGENFPDALAAGPAGGVAKRPLVLTQAAELSDATENFLQEQSDTLQSGRLLGGAGAVSDTAKKQAETAGGTGGELGAARIVKFDDGNDIYWVAFDGDDKMFAVKYEQDDDFAVNGATSTYAGFNANVTVGDIIEGDAILASNADEPGADDPSKAIDAAKHSLRNVSSGAFTAGMVGNVDTSSDQFDFISPVSGEIYRRDLTYTDRPVLIDGGQATVADFEADVSEGDTVVLESNGTWALTNKTISGVATDVDDRTDNVPPGTETVYRINDALGDNPGEGESDIDDTGAGVDDRFEASASPAATGQAFTVNGAESDYGGFTAALNNGDQVSYSRKDGVQLFGVIDDESATRGGQATHDFEPDGDGVPDGAPTGDDQDDGGVLFMVATNGDEIEVEYLEDGEFVVDGDIVDEESFEAAVSAGDELIWRPGDTSTGTEQRLELDNVNLEGHLGTINKTDTPAADDAHAETGNQDAANSYGVLSRFNSTYELIQQPYKSGATLDANVVVVHAWEVNGDEVGGVTADQDGAEDFSGSDETCWEDSLTAAKSLSNHGVMELRIDVDVDVEGGVTTTTYTHMLEIDNEPACV